MHALCFTLCWLVVEVRCYERRKEKRESEKNKEYRNSYRFSHSHPIKSLLSCSGNFYEPTILAIDGAAPASNSAFQTEFFGPVVCLTPFNSEEEGSSLILV